MSNETNDIYSEIILKQNKIGEPSFDAFVDDIIYNVNLYYMQNYLSSQFLDILKNNAEPFLKSYLGYSFDDFLNEVINMQRKHTTSDYIEKIVAVYTSALSDVKEKGYNIDTIMDSIMSNIYIHNNLQTYLRPFDNKIRHKERFENSYNEALPTLPSIIDAVVSREAIDAFINRDEKKILLIGQNYYDIKNSSNVNVFYSLEDFSNIHLFHNNNYLFMPIFDRHFVRIPQHYFLNLNKQFPNIKKCSMIFENGAVMAFKLLEKKMALKCLG